MSLPVPLSVSVDGVHVTAETADVEFRKEAVGGVQSITLRLYRPIDQFDSGLAPLSRVRLFDTRSAETVAEGRLADPGRSAGGDGQLWDMVAFGPAQHASDRTFPYIVVTESLEGFRRGSNSTKNGTTGSDERGDEDPSVLHSAEEGKTVTTSWRSESINRQFWEAGMKLARVRCQIDAGIVNANYVQRITTRTGAGAGASAASATADTTSGVLSATVVTDFTNGNNVFSFDTLRNTSSVTATENHWFEYWDLTARALLLNGDGTEKTTGYGSLTVTAAEVVTDLLGRVLGQFDGTNAAVDTSGTYAIDQMAYIDGITAAQVLDDLMLLEPAFRWTTGPDTGSGYEFRWEPLPTAVRYEAVLEDGGSFPSSTQELFNEVTVRWRHKDGRVRSTTRTLACQVLDDAGITRTAYLDLADEIGSLNGAARAGDNFLAEHNVARNAGTLTVGRPILDLQTGLVEPFQIEPGELIRVRGVESYPDALNASSNDGMTVFRIWSVTYSTAGNSASLELDTYSRTESNALAALARRRQRRR